jgi:hypothetical protein
MRTPRRSVSTADILARRIGDCQRHARKGTEEGRATWLPVVTIVATGARRGSDATPTSNHRGDVRSKFLVIEDRLGHIAPSEYEYEYRSAEYEYEEVTSPQSAIRNPNSEFPLYCPQAR